MNADDTPIPFYIPNDFRPEPVFIGLLHLQNSETKVWTHERTVIILTAEGNAGIKAKGLQPQPLPYGSIVILPPEYSHSLFTHQDASLLIYTIDNASELLEGYHITPTEQPENGASLPIVNIGGILDGYIHEMKRYITDGINQPSFMHAKTSELIQLLIHYCSEEDKARLFSMIANKESKFINAVMTYCKTARSKAELAAAVGLSTSRFGVKFKEVFGMSPYKWLTTRKRERIYNCLIYGHNSLKEISEEFHFGSVQHFNDFCKKHFGMAPGKLRELHSSDTVVCH